jgi:hypothetical protein
LAEPTRPVATLPVASVAGSLPADQKINSTPSNAPATPHLRKEKRLTDCAGLP